VRIFGSAESEGQRFMADNSAGLRAKVKLDGLARSLFRPLFVLPTKAGSNYNEL